MFGFGRNKLRYLKLNHSEWKLVWKPTGKMFQNILEKHSFWPIEEMVKKWWKMGTAPCFSPNRRNILYLANRRDQKVAFSDVIT